MRFIHITDTHIGPTPTYGPPNKPALPALEALVETINNLPFEPDFVLHNGDVTDDASEAAYELAKPILAKLKYPIYYVIGNHDLPEPMLRILLGKKLDGEHFDYTVQIGEFMLAVFDTRGPVSPAGTLTAAQIKTVRDLCQPDGPPLIISIHHQPVPLDAYWLDEKWDNDLSMALDNAAEFRDAVAPARARLRGVFFGHVHRGFQVFQNGVLYCSAPSGYSQFKSWPGQREPSASDEMPGFGVVTVTHDTTIVRQYVFPRPEPTK